LREEFLVLDIIYLEDLEVTEPSRSGGGIQSDNKVRPGAFSTVKYLSQILNNIKEKLK